MESDPLSNYPLRSPESLVDDARKMANAQGVSINQFLSTLIAERTNALKALCRVRQRIGRANSNADAAIQFWHWPFATFPLGGMSL